QKTRRPKGVSDLLALSFSWDKALRPRLRLGKLASPDPLLLVGLGRLERPTSRLSGVRSNHLSYRPNALPKRHKRRKRWEDGPRKTKTGFSHDQVKIGIAPDRP
ncbi:unnamed protein product, partial [Pararhodospirillum photometricum DSM 122]